MSSSSSKSRASFKISIIFRWCSEDEDLRLVVVVVVVVVVVMLFEEDEKYSELADCIKSSVLAEVFVDEGFIVMICVCC
jgi:hypothetical protein